MLELVSSRPRHLWRAALVADPLFLPAHAGLGELYLKAANAGGVAAQGPALRELDPDGSAEAAVLEAAAREFPQSVGVRVTLLWGTTASRFALDSGGCSGAGDVGGRSELPRRRKPVASNSATRRASSSPVRATPSCSAPFSLGILVTAQPDPQREEPGT